MLYNTSITSSVSTAISEVENGCYVGNGHMGNGEVGNGYVGNGDMGNGDMGNGDVGRYHFAVIRPVLEYCSCIWHHNITNKLSLQIEAIQKRVIKSYMSVPETCHMLTACILLSCLLSSTAGKSRLVTSSGLCSTLTHACTACCLHRAIQILLPDSELPTDFRHWLLEPKISVFYKFWPPKLPINLAPFGKPVVFLLF